MGLGGRLTGWLLWFGALSLGFEARAQEGGVSLVFDASAQGFSQAEVRAAVERELGRTVAGPSESAKSEVTILVDSGRLVVRYRTQTGSVDRYLPMPSDPNDVPLMVSLAVGNLVREPTTGSVPAGPVVEAPAPPVGAAPTKPVAPPPPAAKPAPAPPSEPAFVRHWVGVHAAQDIAFMYDDSVCHHVLGPEANYSCYYAGTTNEPFFHHSPVDDDFLDDGPKFATTRVLLSYDYAIEPRVSVGTRLGYAFGGGPPAGQAPDDDTPPTDPNLIPAHTRGRGGEAFLPLHAELRASYWFLPLTNRTFRAYAGAGFGVAQVDSKHETAVHDCAETLDPSWNPADGTFDDCMSLTDDFNRAAISGTTLDAWKKMGRGFVSTNVGATLSVKGELSIVLNVNAMYMFPDDGFVLEPSLGVMTEL